MDGHHDRETDCYLLSGDMGIESIKDFGRTSTIETRLHICDNTYVPDTSTKSHDGTHTALSGNQSNSKTDNASSDSEGYGRSSRPNK